jgi:hypothetical protein
VLNYPYCGPVQTGRGGSGVILMNLDKPFRPPGFK